MTLVFLNLVYELHGLSDEEIVEVNEQKQKSIVSVADITSELREALYLDRERIYQLSPGEFEILIRERLKAAGFEVFAPTNNVYTPDGGIDVIASLPPMLGFIIVQIKHHRSAKNKVGRPDVQKLYGAYASDEMFTGAMLVTNTSFAKKAKKMEQSHPFTLKLKDGKHLHNWLVGDFSDMYDFSHLPESIKLSSGIEISKSRFFDN